MALSKTEEELMQHLWECEKAYLSDLLDMYPKPKPATTTVSTLLKRMIEKGYVAYNQHGRSREYYPVVSKPTYFAQHFDNIKKKFFEDSTTQFASFFASETDLTTDELKDLKNIIDKELKKKNQ